MRLIDADALELEAYGIWVHGAPETKYRMNALKDLIDEAPTITVQHWIGDVDHWICPVCRLEVTNPNNYEGCKCPRCGFQDPKDAMLNEEMREDLISRKMALERIDDIFNKTDPTGEEQLGVLACRRSIREMPGSDAAKVVRCMNCRHSVVLKDSALANESPWRYYRMDCRLCLCEALIGDEPIVVDGEFYCAHGKEIDEGKNEK